MAKPRSSAPSFEALLVRYVETRDDVDRLTRERAACICDFESRPNHDRPFTKDDPPLRVRALFDLENSFTTNSARVQAKHAPCWRYIVVDQGDGETQPIGDWTDEGWCEPCLRRTEMNFQLRAAKHRRTSRLGALISATRARLMPPRPTPETPAAPTEATCTPPLVFDDTDDFPF